MPDIDTQVPPWLAKNWGPTQSSMTDPAPWLNEAYRQSIERKKLPLKLQSMALQNQADQLAIDHQGMVNDLTHQELNNFAEDQPVLQENLIKAAQTPGGSLSLPVPAFKSKAAAAAWVQRQHTDLSTSYAASRNQVILDQGKTIAAAMPLNGKVYEPRADGTFAPEDMAEAAATLETERQRKEAESLKTWQMRTGYHYDEEGNPIAGTGPRNIMPEVVSLDVGNGKKIQVVRNPQTGAFHPVSQLTHGSDSDRAEISINKARIAQLYKAHDDLNPEATTGFFTSSHPNVAKRQAIKDEINQLIQRNRELSGEGDSTAPTTAAPAATPAPTFRFVPGKGIVPISSEPDAAAPDVPIPGMSP